MKGRLLATVVASLAFAGAAFAATTTTIESKVTVVPPAGTEKVVTYKVTGPDKTEYVLDAPEAEVEKLVKVVEANPETVVKFDGTIEGKTFKVTKWENPGTEVTHTETTTKTTH
jgi:hypothetical protein